MPRAYNGTIENKVERLMHESVTYCRKVIGGKGIKGKDRIRGNAEQTKIALEVVKFILTTKKVEKAGKKNEVVGRTLEELLMGGKEKDA